MREICCYVQIGPPPSPSPTLRIATILREEHRLRALGNFPIACGTNGGVIAGIALNGVSFACLFERAITMDAS